MPEPTTIKATTQDYLDVDDVTQNIILLKDGSASMVLQISAVNFALLSEEEQDAIIYAYAALLNSLSFPIQILIRSQKKDISDYVKVLEQREQLQRKPILKNRIAAYRQFVEQLVKERNVLDKKFYVAIPFARTELGLSPSDFSPLKQAPQELPYEKDYILQKALNILEPRRDHLIRQFARLGLTARQLPTQELIQLLYVIHNPDAAEGIQALTSEQYQQSIVQSRQAVAPPAQPAPPQPQS